MSAPQDQHLEYRNHYPHPTHQVNFGDDVSEDTEMWEDSEIIEGICLSVSKFCLNIGTKPSFLHIFLRGS